VAKKKTKSKASPRLSFEETIRRLEEIVHALEEGRIDLEDSLARYEEGVKLLREGYGVLARAERRIELLSGVDADGKAICTALDDEALSLDEKARQRSRRRSASGPVPPTEDDSPGAAGEDNGVDSTGRLF